MTRFLLLTALALTGLSLLPAADALAIGGSTPCTAGQPCDAPYLCAETTLRHPVRDLSIEPCTVDPRDLVQL